MTSDTKAILKKLEKEPGFFNNITETMGDALCLLLLEYDGHFKSDTLNIVTNLAQKRLELRSLDAN